MDGKKPLTLPEGAQATITAYVTSGGASLSTHRRAPGVTRLSGWCSQNLIGEAVEELNAVTGLGDARPMTEAEIRVYLKGGDG